MSDNVLKLKIADLQKIQEENGQYVRTNGVGAGSSFSSDPDYGTLEDRLSGRFDWAFKEMAKASNVAQLGNVESLQPDFEFGLLDGTEVDFDQYLIHNPRCLGRIYQNQAPNGERTINLVACIGMMGSTRPAELVRKTAPILAIAKQYDEAGYNVKMFACFAVRDSYGSRISLCIVDCSMASVGQSLSAFCSALVFRSIIFDAIGKIGLSPNSVQAISCEQNSGMIPDARKMISRHVQDAKIVFLGQSNEAIKKELNS